MANLSTGGLSKFRRWYTQYKAIHGMEPPQDLMDSYLAAEMEAEQAGQDRSRQISLQEKSLDQTKDYQDKSLAQRDKEFAAGLKQQKDQMKANEQAATVSGVKDLASLGMEGYKVFGNKANSIAPATSSQPISSGFANAPTRGVGGGDGGYGEYSYGEGADLGSGGSMSLGVTDTVPSGSYLGVTDTVDTGTSLGSGATSKFGAGSLGRGIGTAVAGAAIDYSRKPVTEYIQSDSKRYGVEGAKAADISSYIGQGALTGSNFGGLGAGIGAVVGAEYGGAKQAYGLETKKQASEYNKAGGVAALFGITAGQVETEQDSSSIKTAKAVLTGGASKIAKKLKKLF